MNPTTPCDVEAEQSALGAMLMNADSRRYGIGSLTEKDFYLEKHAWIFKAIRQLDDRGDAPDLVTLSAMMGDHASVLDSNYLGMIYANTMSIYNIPAYVKILKTKAMARRLIDAATKIAGHSYNGATDPDALYSQCMDEMAKTTSAMSRGFESVDTVMGRIAYQTAERYADPKQQIGIQTGYKAMDESLSGIQVGLHIWGGRPSSGKTAAALSTAYQMAKRKTKVGYVSLEMTGDELVSRLVSYESGYHTNILKSGMLNGKGWDCETYDKIRLAQSRVGNMPIYFSTTGIYTSNQIRAQMQDLIAKQGIEIFFVDYVQLFGDEGDNRNQVLDKATLRLKDFSREYQVPVVLMSQLSRDLERRSSTLPLLSDLRDSGALEQHADVVIMMHREDSYHLTEPNYIPSKIVLGVTRKDRIGGAVEKMIEWKLEHTGRLV